MLFSFLKRRKFLKSANTLELHPIKNYSELVDDEGIVSVLIPKIKNETLRKLSSGFIKNMFMKVKLDKYGSEVWKRIDGEKTVDLIIQEIKNHLSDELVDAENRIINFI
ncbi:MAG: PqqD family protein, partial [Ignavibacterium sp.]|nr:PqqD family protein [Ignavibacterium sp.]